MVIKSYNLSKRVSKLLKRMLGHVVSESSDWAGTVTRLPRVPGDETEGCWSIFEG